MFGKKEKQYITKKEIPFVNFKTYTRDQTNNGDWLIPLGTNMPSQRNTNLDMYSYNPDLVNPYRHQDDTIVLKNVKAISNGNVKNLSRILLNLFIKYEDKINSFPGKLFKSFIELYDTHMRDEATGYISNIHIWIPLWESNTDSATVYSICDRIFIITT